MVFKETSCVCCQDEISGLGIECVECPTKVNLKLCCECFRNRAEIGPHKCDHKYRFFDSGSLILRLKPITLGEVLDSDDESSWSAREEIRLLDAIEQYGFGNWQDISKHIETKDSTEAKSKYVDRYVVGILGKLTWSTSIPNEANMTLCPIQIQKPVDHTLPFEEGPLSPVRTKRLPPLEIGVEEMTQLVYMPNRDDYEKEYDNDAERLVSQLSFSPEDDDLDIACKLAMVDMYSRRLRERARRKRMIRDYQLVSAFFRKERKQSEMILNASLRAQFMAFERDAMLALKPYCQFLTFRELGHLVVNLIKEKELLLRLDELFKYRRHGILRPEDCIEFERRKGGNGPLQLKRKRGLDAIMECMESHEGRAGSKRAHLAEKLAAPLLVRQLQMALPSPNSKAQGKATSSASVGSGVASPSAGRSLTLQPFYREDSNSSDYMESSESGRASYPQDQEQEDPRTRAQATQAQMDYSPSNEDSYLQKERPKGLDAQYTVDSVGNAELLTAKELIFCTKINLTPAQFLTMKTALLLARKPKGEQGSQKEREVWLEIQCPPRVLPLEWDRMVAFFKANYNYV